MLINESIWFKTIIQKYLQKESVVLNIGSSTKEFLQQQPYIFTNVIKPIEQLNCKLLNIDIKKAEGVDIVGDLTNPDFISELKLYKPAMVICANLLEHLEDRKPLINGLISLLDKHTLLVVSVPHVFPYHADPIDTMYRPDINELASEFNGLSVVEAKIVTNGTYYNYTTKHLNPIIKLAGFLKVLVKHLLSNNKEESLWYFKTISTTCIVFKKP
jgi:hypothetical protein